MTPQPSEQPAIGSDFCANCWHPRVNHAANRCWVYLRQKRGPHTCPCIRWSEPKVRVLNNLPRWRNVE